MIRKARSGPAGAGSLEASEPTRRAGAVAELDIWGSRGSRNLVHRASRIGNRTSCYSLFTGESVIVLDAGSGLAALGHALRTERRFASVREAHVFVTHAHLDHWEGLKDVDWFWQRDNGLSVTLYGTEEALETIRRGFAEPAYVPLDRLAVGTVARLTWTTVVSGRPLERAGVTICPLTLNHYSGMGPTRRALDTVGYRISRPSGPVIVYLSDHEPTHETLAAEEAALEGAHLAVLDAQYLHRREHAFGHGSQEHAASLASRYPGARVLAGHLGTLLSDERLRAARREHGRSLPNFDLAVEGTTWAYDPERGFTRRRGDA